MSQFQPPPTWALPVIKNETTGEPVFNPIWLRWFLDLSSQLNAAGTIGDHSVTYVKIQNVSSGYLLGRATAGLGTVEEIALGTNLSFVGTTLNAASANVADGDKGDVTVTSSGTVWTIDNGVVTAAKTSITETPTGTKYLRDDWSWQAVASALADGDKGDITVSGSGATWTIDAGVVTAAKTSITGTPTGAKFLRDDWSWELVATGVSDGDKGDITVTASGATWTIDNTVVTYAKIQNISATSRLLGRKSSGAGSTEELTLSEVLDFIGSAAHGDLLYRGTSTWARLAAGTSGQYLKTLGAGADPAWATVSPVASAGLRNVCINGGFTINQAGYVSGAALASTVYAHDQWKAGVNGGNYTFTQLESETQISLADGKSIVQHIEDKNIQGTDYMLSWEGTACGRVNINTLTLPAGNYANSPITITSQVAGAVMTIEFGAIQAGTTGTAAGGARTLGRVQLERGSVVTSFEQRHYAVELTLCQRYAESSYDVGTAWGTGVGTGRNWQAAASSTQDSWTIHFKVPKRVGPTMYLWSPVTGAGGSGASQRVRTNSATDVTGTTGDVSRGSCYVSVSGGTVVGTIYSYHWAADARY